MNANSQTPPLQITGENGGDNFGWSVAPAGDVNGDGIADIIVGAPSHASIAGFAGRAYLFHGPFTAPLTAAQANGTIAATTFGDNLGIAVASAGDVDSDGFDDVLIGARGNDAAGIQAGRVYLYNGPVNGLLDDTQATATIFGEAFDEVGHEVAGGGDLNGDGIADIVVGAPFANQTAISAGSAHVFYGPLTGTHSTTTADATILGTEFNESLGDALAIGDLNNDGQDDLIVGGPRPPLNGNGTGRAYVIFGPVAGTQSAAASDVILTGQQLDDEFGSSVSVGDINGDSIDDLVVGADQFFNNSASGKAYVFYGPLSAGTIAGANADAILIGATTRENFGASVAAGSDLNGDGIGDLVVGSPAFNLFTTLNGRASAFFGPLTGTQSGSTADLIFTGNPLDQFGHDVAMAPGLQTNGGDGLLISGPAHPNSSSAGIVRVIQPFDAITEFCFGDGSGTACPCGNSGATGNGCANSLNANGANLLATGGASVGNDTLALTGSGMPNASVLYFQGTTQAGAGSGTVFGDGLRCATGAVVRLGTKINTAGMSQYPEVGDQPISVRGAIPAAGGTRQYQAWYRNAASFCTSAAFNLSNGVQVVWAP